MKKQKLFHFILSSFIYLTLLQTPAFAQLVVEVTGAPGTGKTFWTFSGSYETLNSSPEDNVAGFYNSRRSMLPGVSRIGHGPGEFSGEYAANEFHSPTQVALAPGAIVTGSSTGVHNIDGLFLDSDGNNGEDDFGWFADGTFNVTGETLTFSGTGVAEVDITTFGEDATLIEDVGQTFTVFTLDGIEKVEPFEIHMTFTATPPFHPDLLITDRHRNSIVKFDGETGDYKETFAEGLERPRDIEIAYNGLIYVVNSKTKEIIRFKQNGQALGVFGEASFEALAGHPDIGDGFYPWSIEFDNNRNLYVGQRAEGNGKIAVFDRHGNLINTLDAGEVDTQGGMSIAINSQGQIFATTGDVGGLQNVVYFESDGEFKENFGDCGSKIDFEMINGELVFDENDYLYVTGVIPKISPKGEVYKFDPQGRFLGRLEGSFDIELSDKDWAHQGLIFRNDGALFISTAIDGAVRHFDSSGKFHSGSKINLNTLPAEFGNYMRPNAIVFVPFP